MYFGPYAKIKTFSDGVSIFSQLLLLLSIMFFLFYVWERCISKPIEPSSLTRTEGLVIEKSVQNNRQGKTYKFHIKTNEGVKLYSVNKAHSSACCYTHLVPENLKVIALTDWSWFSGLNVYQILYRNKLVFNAIDSQKEKHKKGEIFLILSILSCVLGTIVYSVGILYEKRRKT